MRISDWSSDVCSSDLFLRMENTLPRLIVLSRGPPSGSADGPQDEEAMSIQPERKVAGRDSDGAPAPRPVAGFTRRTLLVASTTGIFIILVFAALSPAKTVRPEERRVGKECVRKCRSRW